MYSYISLLRGAWKGEFNQEPRGIEGPKIVGDPVWELERLLEQMRLEQENFGMKVNTVSFSR